MGRRANRLIVACPPAGVYPLGEGCGSGRSSRTDRHRRGSPGQRGAAAGYRTTSGCPLLVPTSPHAAAVLPAICRIVNSIAKQAFRFRTDGVLAACLTKMITSRKNHLRHALRAAVIFAVDVVGVYHSCGYSGMPRELLHIL